MAPIKQTELLARKEPSGGTAMHWIGGQWLDSGEHRESINPATGEVINIYAVGGRKEAELAVNAALRVFRETDWKTTARCAPVCSTRWPRGSRLARKT